jgi:hypothetical protein
MNNYPIKLYVANRNDKAEGITFGHNERDGVFTHFKCNSRPKIIKGKPSMFIWLKFNGRKFRVEVSIPRDIYCSRREWNDCSSDFLIRFEDSGTYEAEITGIEFVAENGETIKIYSNEHNLNTYNPTQWETFSKAVRSQNYRGKYFKHHNLNPKEYKSHHVDHRIPVVECFRKGWTVEQTNDINNLQLLSDKENLKKGSKYETNKLMS